MIALWFVALLLADGQVALLAPRPSRVADELRRELEASSFVLTTIATDGRPWREQAPPGLARGVAVEDDERRVSVFTIAGGEIRVQAEMSVDPDDRLARRRTAFAVVEYLRLLDSAPRPEPKRDAIAPPPLPPPTRSRIHPWAMGAATTIDFDSFVGEPTSHLLIIGLWRFGEHLDLAVQGLWPIVGSQFQSDGTHVRMWTFGVSAGFVLRPVRPEARFQPYLAVGLGTRFVLADGTPGDGAQSRVAMVPAGTASVAMGARLAVAAGAHLFFEVEGEAAHHLFAKTAAPYELAAADARAGHTAVGLLFEF